MVKRNKYWFKPKAIGWGISYPISWEGWLTSLIIIAVLILLWFHNGISSPERTTKNIVIFIFEVIAIIICFIYLVRNRVEGGLKWRSFKK